MGFWKNVGDLAAKGLNKANEMAEDKMDIYYDNYDKYSERYEDMSNERLKREIDRLRRDTSGDRFKRMARMQAMKDELERRR